MNHHTTEGSITLTGTETLLTVDAGTLTIASNDLTSSSLALTTEGSTSSTVNIHRLTPEQMRKIEWLARKIEDATNYTTGSISINYCWREADEYHAPVQITKDAIWYHMKSLLQKLISKNNEIRNLKAEIRQLKGISDLDLAEEIMLGDDISLHRREIGYDR